MSTIAIPLTASSNVTLSQRESFKFQRGGTQFLDVSGTLTDRLLITFRAPAARLAPLVPAPLELDTHQGFAFLSVCAVEIADMGLAGTPRWLRWHNREFLYRLSVRVAGEPSFITLRSDVSSPALALLGRYFSHFRPHHAQVSLERGDGTLRFAGRTEDGAGDGEVEVELRSPVPPGSVFTSDEEAAQFLLGMTRACDVVDGRVRMQRIEHGPWQPRLVATKTARFRFVDELGQRLGARFELDSTLAVHDVPHVWKAATWL